jgi:hypothetical protein
LLSEAPCEAALDAFIELIETAPTTLAGLQAWASYLGEIVFDEAGPTLVVTLVEAPKRKDSPPVHAGGFFFLEWSSTSRSTLRRRQ